ncbi:hypothetical protein MPER_01729, partial [Moniliophthora perniciosa FA553]
LANRNARSPFAVKSSITLLTASSTVKIGAGLTWDNVHAQLDPFNVNVKVVGGRVPSVGSFLLGGGCTGGFNPFGIVPAFTQKRILERISGGQSLLATSLFYDAHIQPSIFY